MVSKIISKLNLKPRIIKLILIRHAEGYHNKAAEEHGVDEYKNPAWKDAILTDKGIEQSRQLKEFMNNRDVIDIFGQLLNGNKEIMMLKARQTGKSSVASHLMDWKKLYDKHERVRLRKETIKRLFNI
jgi:bisphosphoglycerate-dependent phosphoglycerate mutase